MTYILHVTVKTKEQTSKNSTILFYFIVVYIKHTVWLQQPAGRRRQEVLPENEK
jgi:hypothetical protein